jgi:hypothetical protein
MGRALIQVLGFWLTEMLGFSADYCVTDAHYSVVVEDEGDVMGYTSISDIGVSSLFKNECYYIVPGKYGRSCSPPAVLK